MKRFFSLLILISITLSTPLASADFFSEQIDGADTEVTMIQAIQLNNVSLRDSKEMSRYRSTTHLVTGIKDEAVKRFGDGTIPVYRRYDIITSLDSFVYAMNQHFAYQKMYEQKKKSIYQESARTYMDEAK